jgi:hypothetical protein
MSGRSSERSSVPPPYYTSDELEPLSPNFKPDGFADDIISQESTLGIKTQKQKRVMEIISSDRPTIGAKFMDPGKAADLAFLKDDSDSRGIYEDMALDIDLGTSGIDKEEAEEKKEAKKAVATLPEYAAWDQDFDETQELLRKVEAGEVIFPPDEDDEDGDLPKV